MGQSGEIHTKAFIEHNLDLYNRTITYLRGISESYPKMWQKGGKGRVHTTRYRHPVFSGEQQKVGNIHLKIIDNPLNPGFEFKDCKAENILDIQFNPDSKDIITRNIDNLVSYLGFSNTGSFAPQDRQILSNDVRLRKHFDHYEITAKLGVGDVTAEDRRMATLVFKSGADFDYMRLALSRLLFYPDPPWIKQKEEFKTPRGKNLYTVSVQHIGGEVAQFGYVIEVKLMSDSEDTPLHITERNEILKELGLKEIDKPYFNQQLIKFIEANRVGAEYHRFRDLK